MKIIFIAFALFLPQVSAKAGEAFSDIAEPISVARASFDEKIQKDFPGQGDGLLWRNIKNYSMGVVENEREVIIVFMPRHDRGSLIGGGGEYRINKNSKKIEKFRGYE